MYHVNKNKVKIFTYNKENINVHDINKSYAIM